MITEKPESIPPVIHQIWNDRRVPFDVYREEWIDSWSYYHPDWLYVLWTGETLLRLAKSRYPEYEGFVGPDVPPVVRADFGRLMVLQHWGGLYVDLDYICLKSLDEVLRGRTFVIPQVREGQVTNALIASIPNHPFLQTCIDTAAARIDQLGQKPIQWVCGPVLFQEVVEIYRDSDIWVAPSRLLCPADWKQGFGLRRGVTDEIIHNAGELWPEAHAVTFWAHHW